MYHTGHDHERKLIKKVKDLNGEIVNNASKVHTALKLSQDDQQTITTLRSEVEKAWKMVDTAQSKETSAKETITSLKEEIANLSGLVEKSAALTGSQEGMVQELTAARDELQRQTEEATGTCKVLETQLTNMTEVLEGERLECATRWQILPNEINNHPAGEGYLPTRVPGPSGRRRHRRWCRRHGP